MSSIVLDASSAKDLRKSVMEGLRMNSPTVSLNLTLTRADAVSLLDHFDSNNSNNNDSDSNAPIKKKSKRGRPAGSQSKKSTNPNAPRRGPMRKDVKLMVERLGMERIQADKLFDAGKTFEDVKKAKSDSETPTGSVATTEGEAGGMSESEEAQVEAAVAES